MQDYSIMDVTEKAKAISGYNNYEHESIAPPIWQYYRKLQNERFTSYMEKSGSEELRVSDMDLFIGDERIDIRMLHLVEDMAAEQKVRTAYDNILRLLHDQEVCDPIKFLRKREIIHFQRFREALKIIQDELDSRNFYAFNPAFPADFMKK